MTYGWALVVIVIVVAALVLLVGNPSASDTCSSPGGQVNITNQELTPTGWQIRVSNISGRTLGTSVLPITTGVTAESPNTANLYTPSTTTGWAPGGTLTITRSTAIAYVAGTRYRTDYNFYFNDGDFNRTVVFSCNGTA